MLTKQLLLHLSMLGPSAEGPESGSDPGSIGRGRGGDLSNNCTITIRVEGQTDPLAAIEVAGLVVGNAQADLSNSFNHQGLQYFQAGRDAIA